MEKKSGQKMKYIAIILCVIIAILAVPLLSGILEGETYGLIIREVNPDKAATGIVTHLSISDLDESPALEHALLTNSTDSIKTNKKELDFYVSTYPYITLQGNTTKRIYYEFDGTFFYLEFHEGDKTYPPPYL